MPLPLADIGRLGKGAEDIVQQIQLHLCRNHSDERLKVELAARHRARLLTATQQSVRELEYFFVQGHCLTCHTDN